MGIFGKLADKGFLSCTMVVGADARNWGCFGGAWGAAQCGLVGWWEWSRILRQICPLPGTQTKGAHTESISISPELVQNHRVAHLAYHTDHGYGHSHSSQHSFAKTAYP